MLNPSLPRIAVLVLGLSVAMPMPAGADALRDEIAPTASITQNRSMFGDSPVVGRNPIGTSVTKRTIRIESQAALLIISRMLSMLKSSIPNRAALARIRISA